MNLDDMRDWLGLGADDRVGEARDIPLPPSGVGRAFAPGGILPVVVGFFNIGGRYNDVALPDWTVEGKEPGDAGRIRLPLSDPGTFILEIPDAIPIARGLHLSREDGTILIDARMGDVIVQVVPSRGSECLLVFGRERVEGRLVERQSRLALALENSARPNLDFDLPVLELEMLVGNQECEPWLRDRANALGLSADPVRRLAAPGILARLWAPTSRAEAARLTTLVLAGDDVLGDRIRVWAGKITPAALAFVEQASGLEVQRLIDDLSALEAMTGDPPGDAAQAIFRLAHNRDDLESLVWILRMRGNGSDLAGLLSVLDRMAVCQLTMLGDLFGEPDDHLRAVSSVEPNAWWGALAR